ncbi:MAG: Crp/Fnr family transcriptional regulator [Rhizomicrobium sp.]|nr:Crp/Fnr family transcriptional regulator [Rhizomicrobium sp.]
MLEPHLELVVLPRRAPLEQPQKAIEHLYFMEQGIASVVSANDRTSPVEIGLVGREGVTGIAVILGSATSPHSTFIQAAGSALRIAVKPFCSVMLQSEALRSLVLRYAHVFMVQTAHTAAANATGSIEERLARWLLMAQDRLDNEALPLTHEFLAIMLGTRRPGVTEAVHALIKRGLIRTNRGIIIVVDRDGLVQRAAKMYGGPEAEYEKQIG